MRSQTLPSTEFHQPETFQNRGVAAPFTTPLLAGTRVRDGLGLGIELVVPNPAGTRGSYILRWPGIRTLCNPTLHDRIFVQRLSALSRIDPAGVRKVALEVACEGHAGPDAAAAAAIARDRDHAQAVMTRRYLLGGLIERLEPDRPLSTWQTAGTPAFEQRITCVLHGLARSWGQPAERLAAVLGQISNAFAPAGVPRNDRAARIPRMIARLKATQTDLVSWLRAERDADIGALGQTVMVMMANASEVCDLALGDTRAALTDPIALLQQWLADPNRARSFATRTDWLLDGWEHVCLLWLSAGPLPFRRAALLEMAQLLPIMPPEVVDWVDVPIAREAMDAGCRVISQNDAWRQGDAGLALVQRNEALRALRL